MKKFQLFLIALLLGNGAMAQWAPLTSGITDDFLSVFSTDNNTVYAAATINMNLNDNLLKSTNGGLT
jgi:hypothetical protein